MRNGWQLEGGRAPAAQTRPPRFPVCRALETWGEGTAGPTCTRAASGLTAAQTLAALSPPTGKGSHRPPQNLCCRKGTSRKRRVSIEAHKKGQIKRQALGETEEGHSSSPGLGGRGSLGQHTWDLLPTLPSIPSSLPAWQAFTLADREGEGSPLELRSFSTPRIHDSVLTQLSEKIK